MTSINKKEVLENKRWGLLAKALEQALGNNSSISIKETDRELQIDTYREQQKDYEVEHQ